MVLTPLWIEHVEHGLLVVLPVRPAQEALPLLPQEEAVLAKTWAPRRQATFAAGRLALRMALEQAGVVVPGPFLRNDRGAPVVPVAGVRGSITHTDGYAAALVRTGVDDEHHIGVDLEELARAPRDDIARLVLTPAELHALQAITDVEEKQKELLSRFSLKEALYKALDPYVRRYVGFLEVEVAFPVSEEPETGRAKTGPVSLHLTLSKGEGPFMVEARLLLRDGLIISTARVRRA